MKTKAYSIVIVLALLTYWLGLGNASAFYDPGAQRWLNRDPMTSLDHSFGGDLDRTCYVFVGNAPPAFIDPNGLWVWWGNWGGPDWTAGNPTTWENVMDQNLKQKPAQDAQDSCYEAHDKCYAQSRDNFRAAPAERWQSAKMRLGRDLRHCDRDLAQCLNNLPKDDPSNNCHAKIGTAVFDVLGNIGHTFEPDPPPRHKRNEN